MFHSTAAAAAVFLPPLFLGTAALADEFMGMSYLISKNV